MSYIKKKIMMISILAGIASTVLDGCSKDDNQTKYVSETIDEDNKKTNNTVNDITYKKIFKVLEKNENINDEYKEEIKEVISRLQENFPNIELKYLYKNIKTLKIKTTKEIDEYVVGNYDPDNNIINLVKGKSFHYLHHEILHLLNNYKDEKHFYNERGFAFNEGFVEWLNIKLFPSDVYSYKMQVADIEIIQDVLDLTDEEFINIFIDKDINYLSRKIRKYSNKEDIDELIDICDLEKDKYELDDKYIKSSEICKKYEVLLQLMVTSKDGLLDSYQLYSLYKKLYKSFITYIDRIYDDDLNLTENLTSYLKDKCMKLLLIYSKEENNNLTIYQDENIKLRYYDINNLYLGTLEENGVIYQSIFEQVEHNNEESYYDLLDINNQYVSEYKFIPLNDLDIYDGINTYEIFEEGYNKIKTYSK